MTQRPTTEQPGDAARVETVVPSLEQGDRLDQQSFHERYEAMPAGTKAELVAGVVNMPSPAKKPHSRNTGRIGRWLGLYEDATPGVEMHDNGSNLLGPESEPQPDACLLIEPACGGQTSEKDDWIVGAPELVAEVAVSTEAIDLHGKKVDYERAGVKEYLVLALRQRKFYWFVSEDEEFVELTPGEDDIYRSIVFPGLWLDANALLATNMKRVYEVLNAGLASQDHADFVASLAARRQEKAT